MNPCDLTNKKMTRLFRIAALISYGIGFIYIENFWDSPDLSSGLLLFSVLFIICTEWFANASGRTFSALRDAGLAVTENIIFLVCAVAQAAAMYGYGMHKDMELAQFFMWHVMMVCYVISRTGMLVSGRIGPLFWLDMIQGFFALPFGNIHLRILSIFSNLRKNNGAVFTPAPAYPGSPTVAPAPGIPKVGANAPASANPGAAANVPGSVVPGVAANEQAPVFPGAAANTPASANSEAAAFAKKPAGKYSKSEKWLIAAGVLFGLILTAVIWNELTGVSSAFSDLDLGIGKLIHSFFETYLIAIRSFYETYLMNFFDDFIPKLIFSIPVGAWLFGLVGGSLKRSRPVFTEEEFRKETRTWHAFPIVTLYIVSGMLCAVYALFFAVSIREIAGLAAVTAPEASHLAVNGFWQLVRIVIINIATLGIYSMCLRDSEKNAAGSAAGWSGMPRLLLTIQFAFTTAFAVLAGWKLFCIYIGLFGPTPRRMLSGWFLLILLLACLLIILRLYKKTAAARIVILTATVTFSILCCLPVEQICR